MPAKRKNEKIIGRFYTWKLGRREGVYFADGRSNTPHDVGRHSLSTRDRQEALDSLDRLDLVQAVKFGLAQPSELNALKEPQLTLEEGRKLYLQYAGRPPVMGGAGTSTLKRYRSVFNKFIAFAEQEGVRSWNLVTKRTLEAYGAWLDAEDYSVAAEYLELTTIKQTLKWLIEEKHLPASCSFALPLEKPKGTTTYCYLPEEVAAILAHCAADPELVWLGQLLTALVTTGLRISELSSLRWDDLDFGANTIRLVDTRQEAKRTERQRARSTKSHRDRVLPIFPDLRAILQAMPRHTDGRVFHGPRGGVVKPDTIRNVLRREVLEPLSERFPAVEGKKSFRDGRIHSFRHYFCSVAATSGVPEQMLMKWLGHADSRMVRHYFHLHDASSQKHMASVPFLGEAKAKGKAEGAKE